MNNIICKKKPPTTDIDKKKITVEKVRYAADGKPKYD